MDIHNGAWNWTRTYTEPAAREMQQQFLSSVFKGEKMTDTTLISDGGTLCRTQELPELLYDNETMDYLPYKHNNCTIEVNRIDGLGDAIYGLGLSKGLTSDMTVNEFYQDDKLYEHMLGVARKLAGKGGGHDKFLESIQVWFVMDMPRYFWQEFDTYRVGGSKQSESTMYTLGKKKIGRVDFVEGMGDVHIINLQTIAESDSRIELKKYLPEGFLQKRALNYNLKSLLTMYQQRKTHRLVEWRMLCKVIEKLMLDILEVDIMKR